MTTVVVAGALASKPFNGGEAWNRMTWARGFQRLGCRVYFVEDPPVAADDRQREWFHNVTREFGFGGASFLLEPGGLVPSRLARAAATADLLVNISGELTAEPLLDRFSRAAYVDLDPGYTQFWNDAGLLGDALSRHAFHFTVGLNVGLPTCEIPTGGFDWQPILPPVVVADWRDGPAAGGRFTTVASWRGGFGPIRNGATTYGLKCHEWRKLASVPTLCTAPFEAALDLHPADARDHATLSSNGWSVVDATDVSATPGGFRRYVQGSMAEFSPAQGIYVQTRSGWFSDRTTRYLAAGRPAVVQDTGWTCHLPSGSGLLAFTSEQDAAASAAAVAADPVGHGEAAQTIAEERFSADVVLANFLSRCGL